MARKKKPEERNNHERWLVSYADFITLLFAFFVVLYAISQINEGKYRVLSDSFVTAFQSTETKPILLGMPQAKQNGAFAPIPMQRPDTRRQQQQLADIAHAMRKVMENLMKQGQVRVTQNSRGVMVEINASLLFMQGLATLEAEATQSLSSVAEVLAKVDNPIQVEGYTDNTPINNNHYPSNWELSTARASSVVRLFLEKGIASERLAAVGYAENRKVQPNTTAEGRARNRRVTVMILPPVLPASLEGSAAPQGTSDQELIRK